MSVGIISDPHCLRHENGVGHPESPARLQAIEAMLQQASYADQLVRLSAGDASGEQLGRVHDADYIAAIRSTQGKIRRMLDMDTSVGPDTWAAATRSAGAVIAGCRAIMEQRVSTAFAFVRPPGHHAERNRAMGFCIFNNAAVAAEYVLHEAGARRVFIVDWDVHHGNGTQNIFYERSDLFYFSVHQYPLYPGSGSIHEIGSGAGVGYTLNVPLPAGSGDTDYLHLFQELLSPAVRSFRPEFIVVSAGFDAHKNDPLASMQMSSEGYRHLTAILIGLAQELCDGHLLFVLEGGYNLGALGEGVDAVLRALIELR